MVQFLTQPATSRYLIAAIFILAGTLHFIKPGMYVRIMPDYIPSHRLMVYLSGVAEILGGAGLLLDQTRNWAAWGIILLLIVFLTVHIDMPLEAYRKQDGLSVYFVALLLRIPLQFLLIYGVYWACILY